MCRTVQYNVVQCKQCSVAYCSRPTYSVYNVQYGAVRCSLGSAVLCREAGITCWLERRTRDRKAKSSNPGRNGGRIFFSRVDFVCLPLFGVRSTPVLPQWNVKEPGHSAKSAGGRLHLNMHTSLTQRSRSPLSRNSVVNLSGKRAHTQLVREYLAAVASAR